MAAAAVGAVVALVTSGAVASKALEVSGNEINKVNEILNGIP
ncbi:MAG: hypothetical protein Q8R78_02465 [Candidatus Omnitrophota bacterium]|nr:hypothetical protein [Candidatus Omnitrophota bacterium]